MASADSFHLRRVLAAIVPRRFRRGSFARPPLLGYLEEPIWSGSTLVVRGWVASQGTPVAAVHVLAEGREYATEYRLERPDVARALPDFGQAMSAGFYGEVAAAPGCRAVDVWITLRDGRRLLAFTARITGKRDGDAAAPVAIAPAAPEASATPVAVEPAAPEAGKLQWGLMSRAIAQEVRAIRASGLFDDAYYRAMYADIGAARIDVIRHYCEIGWREGRNPCDEFDTRFYLDTYDDIRIGNMNPFYHYVIAGASELRHALPDQSTRLENDINFGPIDADVKLIAFYVTPSWQPVRRGRPRFKGHRQPLLPSQDWGFYTPTEARVLRRQAELARRHGVSGFCFDLSDSANGDRPNPIVRLLLDDREIDFRFALRIELTSSGVAEAQMSLLGRAVTDHRYISVAGCPVIIIDTGGDPRNAQRRIAVFKTLLGSRRIKSPYLILRSGSDFEPPEPKLWDAVLDLPHHPVPGETGEFVVPRNDSISASVFPYSAVVAQGLARMRNALPSPLPVFPAISVGRDHTGTGSDHPVVYKRFNLREYRRWLDAALAAARQAHPADRRFVFLSAWNGWNHGQFLEPDTVGGYNRLNETSRALLGIPVDTVLPKVSVVVINYNHERFLRQRLDSIYGQTYTNIEVLLLDDCSSDGSREVMDRYAAANPAITRRIYSERNGGSPFRQWSKGIKAATGDLVWIAESDDYCDRTFLEVLVRHFEDEAVLLAAAKCVFVHEDGVPFDEAHFRLYIEDLGLPGKWDRPYVETAHNEVQTALGIKNTIPNASGVMFRRPPAMPLLDDESWLSMRVAGDWIFYLHIARGGKMAFDSRTSNYFRRYEGSAAEVTYRRDIFYREVGLACRTVAALYNVPVSVLERSRSYYLWAYRHHGGENVQEFSRWFDYDAILKARNERLPNVMICTMGFFPGGAEILPIRLANEYKRQGLSVLLFNAALNPREDGVRRMVRNDVPIVETPAVEPLRSLIKEFGIEALHTHQWHIQKYPLRCREVFDDVKIHVASLHGMIEHGDAFQVTRDQLLAADRAVTTWVYTAEKNLAPFRKLGLYDAASGRFVQIPNGMEPPPAVSVPRDDMHIPDDAFVLCCVSRAIPDKSWAEMIEVVRLARQQSGRDIRLILVGNGPVHDDYCRTGAPDFVYLAGFSEDSVGHYAAADMGIMLTKFKSESFPLTVVDCLFAGRPYIASDVGDIRNMLTTANGVAGEVIELDDWEVPIERAAGAVAAFATDPARYAAASSRVAEAARRYHIESVAAEYVRLFARATVSPSTGGDPAGRGLEAVYEVSGTTS